MFKLFTNLMLSICILLGVKAYGSEFGAYKACMHSLDGTHEDYPHKRGSLAYVNDKPITLAFKDVIIRTTGVFETPGFEIFYEDGKSQFYGLPNEVHKIPSRIGPVLRIYLMQAEVPGRKEPLYLSFSLDEFSPEDVLGAASTFEDLVPASFKNVKPTNLGTGRPVASLDQMRKSLNEDLKIQFDLLSQKFLLNWHYGSYGSNIPHQTDPKPYLAILDACVAIPDSSIQASIKKARIQIESREERSFFEVIVTESVLKLRQYMGALLRTHFYGDQFICDLLKKAEAGLEKVLEEVRRVHRQIDSRK